jgi:hypothetical protein
MSLFFKPINVLQAVEHDVTGVILQCGCTHCQRHDVINVVLKSFPAFMHANAVFTSTAGQLIESNISLITGALLHCGSTQAIGVAVSFSGAMCDLKIKLGDCFQPSGELTFQMLEAHQPNQAVMVRSHQEEPTYR